MQASRQRRSTLAAAAAAAAVIVALAGCAPAAPAHSQNSHASRRTGGGVALARISALRSLFNRDDGHPRLLLIFSPT